MIALRNSISNLPSLKTILKDCKSEILTSMYNSLDDLQDVFEIIDSAIEEEPPITIKEGGIIKSRI
jgi:DNA mismatch repair protein MutS